MTDERSRTDSDHQRRPDALDASVRGGRPWYRKKRWIAAMVVGLLVLIGVMGDPDTAPEATDSATADAADSTQREPKPDPEPEQPDPEPEQAADQQPEGAPEYSRRDRRVCSDFTDLIVSETGEPNADSLLDLGQQLRRLANRADNFAIGYHIEGMANDVDGMIEGGATSARMSAYQDNMGSVATLCADAVDGGGQS